MSLIQPQYMEWFIVFLFFFPPRTPYEVPEHIPMEGPLQTFVRVCHENGQWMSRLPEKLWDIPLYNLALPGKD